jgi:5-guanidino-2-oxopentanoate decarboxylase
MTERITGGQAVVKALSFLDVDTIFGIPGLHNLAIYSALLDSTINHVTVRHEQSAGFMADGYSRTTGKVGVALTISGPGLTNILTAMGEAYHEAVPILVISTNLPTRYLGGRSGMLHELSQSNSMVRSVSKESRRVPHPEAIIPYIIEAHHLALEGRPGPVHIEIPLDILENITTATSIEAMRQVMAMLKSSPSDKTPHHIEEAMVMLKKARQPLVIVGGGAWQAGKSITQLAEMLAAPILLSAAAKGTISDNHPLCLGVRHHFPAIRSYLENVDVVLAFGTELSEDGWGNPFTTKGKLIQVDKDASVSERNVKAHICLTGDANIVAALFNNRVQARPDRLKHAHKAIRDLKKRASQEISLVNDYKDLQYILEFIKEIRRSLPKNSILVTDSTRPAYVAFSEFPAYIPRSFLFPCGFGTLGMALPAAIGAKLAHPEKPVCVLAGDGGFQFTMPELGTACQENLNIPIIIFNDHGYGEIRIYEEKRHPGRRIGVDLQNPLFESLAAAYCIPYFRISKSGDLGDALRASIKFQGPSLIEIDATESIRISKPRDTDA